MEVEQSAHTKQAETRRMHVTRGFYPGKGAKHNLEQGWRGQAEVEKLPRSSEEALEALIGGDLWSGGVKLPYRDFR